MRREDQKPDKVNKKFKSNVTHNRSGANAGKRKLKTVGIETILVNCNCTFQPELESDDDCVVVYDNTEYETYERIAGATAEIRDGKGDTLNGISSSVFYNTTCDNEDCNIIFDSSLEAADNVSLNNCAQINEVAGNSCLNSVQQPLDRQTMHILEARGIGKGDLDVEVDVLDFEPVLLHQLSYKRQHSRKSREELMLHKINIRMGKWSKQEDKILLRNYYKFVEKYGIDNPVILLGLYAHHKKSHIQEFLHAKKFYFHLGRDLNDRPIYSIYERARRLLDSWSHKGKCTNEEIEKVVSLQKKMGNKWSTIAVHLKRPSMTCKAMHRYFGKKFRCGNWTPQEDYMLLKAVKRLVGKTNLLSEFRGYPWKEISKCVPSRNELQCRNHWLNSLCWKLRYLDRPKWKRIDSALLIYSLYSNMVEEECFIDWNLLYDRFNTSVTSYSNLQQHWYRLKCKVPDRAERDHESIVMYLYKIYVPKILKRLNIFETDLMHMLRN